MLSSAPLRAHPLPRLSPAGFGGLPERLPARSRVPADTPQGRATNCPGVRPAFADQPQAQAENEDLFEQYPRSGEALYERGPQSSLHSAPGQRLITSAEGRRAQMLNRERPNDGLSEKALLRHAQDAGLMFVRFVRGSRRAGGYRAGCEQRPWPKDDANQAGSVENRSSI
jgi:hypothetical protein